MCCAGSGQGFAPVERELVFDIDLTDYDDVRTCGKEGHICSKCWPLMGAAIKVRKERTAVQADDARWQMALCHACHVDPSKYRPPMGSAFQLGLPVLLQCGGQANRLNRPATVVKLPYMPLP